MTRSELIEYIKENNLKLRCTFGGPGEGGYNEFYGDQDGNRYRVSNGSWSAVRPFKWTIEKVNDD